MCYKLVLTVLSLTAASIGIAQSPAFSPAVDTQAIPKVMQAVADWQLANPSKDRTTEWTYGALFAGLVTWAQMAETDYYFNACMGFGLKNNWQLGRRTYHADDHAVAQMYLSLYEKYRDPAMIAPLVERFNLILANQPDTPLTYGGRRNQRRYNWCDALFMAPPVWARLASLTDNRAYLDYMNKEWWATTDYLYDPEEHLYFRDDRYFEQREANGQKIFWSRGNGWVLGGLVRVIANLPENYPDRPKYLKLYREMAARLVTLQGADGLWRSSLLDPAAYPSSEASGSGFFCYGLAWGVNRGLLDAETYLPAIKKAWRGLVGCVHVDGKLGWVQPVGGAPKAVTADMTDIYGVGSFLLAGTEVFKIALRGSDTTKLVQVTNPTTVFRPAETLSLAQKSGEPAPAVLDLKTNRRLTTQATHDGQLLFQADLAPGERRSFWLLPTAHKAPASKRTTFARQMTERYDDFAWENDRIAFRMYARALEWETVSPGIDVWAKKVDYPVIQKWYAQGDYHSDHGEGVDFYKVGPTLGCGGLAICQDGKLSLSRNFVSSKVLDNGPIRSTFELTYEPWTVGAIKVSETKRISLDLGSNLNRIESRMVSESPSLPLATGIVKRNGGAIAYDLGGSWLAYEEPANAENGTLHCAIVMSQATVPTVTDSHLLLTFSLAPKGPLIYYTGASWDRSGQFENFGDWQQYVANFAQRIRKPIEIKISKIE